MNLNSDFYERKERKRADTSAGLESVRMLPGHHTSDISLLTSA